ncbi:hypothetical protein TSOC_010495, partial [Tetrabaena socialis]
MPGAGSGSNPHGNSSSRQYRQKGADTSVFQLSATETLHLSLNDAGDIMIIKDALHYFGGGRMVARDLALNNTRPATAGTLVIVPLVHRCRALGCVYVFARNEFNLSLTRSAWSDLAETLSRAVFSQLVGRLRHEWYAVLSEDTHPRPPALPPARGGGGNKVRRTVTSSNFGGGHSGASSMRASFELPSRSYETASFGGGGGGWPELVDILYDMNRTRNVSVYLAAYRGRAVAVKMLRAHMSMDGRPGHLDSEALTITAQYQLSCVNHPNVLRVLMVYPLVYEVVAGRPPDAYEACSTARSTKERRQCFEVYGLDADKVDRYYERVVQMERLIDQ